MSDPAVKESRAMPQTAFCAQAEVGFVVVK
jgi:hypothetical protein